MRKMIKKLCSVTMAAVMVLGAIAIPAMADAPAPVKTVEYVTGNILVDGSFENGVAGWTATDATISHTITDTYNNTAGAGVVTPSAPAEASSIYQTANIMDCTWYTYKVAVKMESGSATAALKLDDVAVEEDTTAVTDEWTIVEGYFKNEPATNNANYCKATKIALEVTGTGKYYVDEFAVTPVEGFYNPDFSKGTDGWAEEFASGSSTKLEKNVSDNYYTLTSNNAVAIQRDALLEKNAVYEVSAKIRFNGTLDEKSYVRIRTSKGHHGDITSPYLATTAVTGDKWHTINATFSYTGTTEPYFCVQFRIDTNGVKSGSAVVKTYDIQHFTLKKIKSSSGKQGNIFKNPHYMDYSTANTSPFVSKLGNNTGWKATDNVTAEYNFGLKSNGSEVSNEDNNTIKNIDTPDNSNTRLKFVAGGDSTNARYVYQDGIILEKNRKYNISVDLKGEEGNTGTYVMRTRHYVPKESGDGVEVGANDYMLSTGSTEQTIPTSGWTHIENKNYDFTYIPEENYVDSQVGIITTNMNGKALYIDNFVIEPIYEAPRITKPVISSAVAGKKLTAPEITVADSADAYSLRYRYLISDNAEDENKTPIATGHTVVGENIPGIDIPASCEGKYLTLEVTGVSDKGVWATAVESEPVEVTGLYTVTAENVNGYTGEIVGVGTVTAAVTITNKDTVNPMQAAVIIAYYEDGRLADVAVTDKRIAANDDEPFNPSINLPATLGTNPSVKVFVWKGHNGTAFQMQPLTASFPK